MDKFVSLVLSGGVSGAIYSLLAVGLVLNYSTARVFNFGHGATAFSAAYLFFQLNTGLGWPTWLCLLLTVGVFAPAAGLAWDRLVFRKLQGASEATTIVASVGVLIVMPAAIVWVTDVLKNTFDVGFADASTAYKVPGVGPNPPALWHVTRGLTVDSDQLIVLVVGVVAFAALWGLLRWTPLGLRLRAAVDKRELAGLRGINAATTSRTAWLLSFFLAGLAGVLAAPFPGPFGLASDNYTFALFVAAAAAVTARFRSLPIAFLAGIALGAVRNLGEGYLNGQYLGSLGQWIDGVYGLRSSLPYWILFAALVAVGVERGRRAAGVASEAAPPPGERRDVRRWRRHLPWACASVLLLVYALGPADRTWRGIVLSGLATGIIFMSFTVVTGIGGMVSLAQPTFVGGAALTAGLALSHGWPFLVALALGVVAASAVGAIVALPAIRLGGLSLTLATLALALLGASVLFNVASFTNGTSGWTIHRPALGAIDLQDDRSMVVALLLLVVLVGTLVGNLQRSASGRAMAALRSSPAGAAAAGVPLSTTKLTVFVTSAAIAGLGGVLLASVDGFVRGGTYPPIAGFLWLSIVVIVGVRRPQSAVVAGLAFAAMPRVILNGVHVGAIGWDGTTSRLVVPMLFGLGAIGLAKQPDGALAAMAEHMRRLRSSRAAPPQMSLSTRAERLSPLPFVVHASAGTPSILVLRSVSAGYGDVEVLHDVTLEVPEGSIVALLGANGAGKSTLCSVIGGLIRPRQGSIHFEGRDITRMPPHLRAREGVVLVPESRGIFPGLTVDENLQLWLKDSAKREAVYDRFANIARRRAVLAANLSGGEQQMLSLAPMLVRPPKVLVADEPTLGLSLTIAAEVLDALRAIRDQGTTLVLVEEKARDALSIADVVAVLSLGRLEQVGDAISFDAQQLTSAYLGAAAAASS